MDTASGLYCVPGAIPEEAREGHFTRVKHLFTEALLDAVRIESGYRYSFGWEELGEIGMFLRYERTCCPFLSFVLSVTPGSAVAELEVTGPADTPRFLEAEYGHGRIQVRPSA